MKIAFNEVNELDRERLLRASEGILKASKLAFETRELSDKLGVEVDDDVIPTMKQIQEMLAINDAIIKYLKET